MNDFELPLNIKQIGAIGDGLKIYMEDYVHTYLKQYADSGGYNDKRAFLIGKHIVIDAQPYLFISGAVQGKFSEIEDGIGTFSEKSFAYAEEEIDKYFRGYEIVGWMQSQPGYGIILNQTYADFHMANFTKQNQILFVMDSIEKLNCFYTWNDDMSGLKELKGYIIYYDKNPGMQEYMLENKVVRLSARDRAAKREADKSEVVKDSRFSRRKEMEGERVEGGKAEGGRTEGGRTEGSKTEGGKPDAPENNEYRKVVNMLVSLSAVLFVICFIMGAGLIQNDGRINKLEKNITTLDSAYNYLLTSVSKTGVSDVFAETGGGTEDVNTEDVNSANGSTVDINTVNNDAADGSMANSGTGNNGMADDNIINGDTADGSTTNDTASSGNPDNATQVDGTEIYEGEIKDDTILEVAEEGTDKNGEVAEATATPPSPTENAVTTPVPTENTPASNTTSNTGGAVPETYVVQKGDSLNYISTKYYGSTDMVDAIMAMNNLDDPDKIFFGKVLLLPQP